jgi:hypothetical protein
MKKYIILSVNDNPDYLFHVPLTVWAWRKIGWDAVVMYSRVNEDRNDRMRQLEQMVSDASGCDAVFRNAGYWDGYLTSTIAQVSRLYASCFTNGYVMTADADMLPLSDYWQPDYNKLTVWGRDLTDHHYPICYIGAPSDTWKEIMNLNSKDPKDCIKRDLDSLPQAKGMDKTKRWVTDQDLITERINNSGFIPFRKDRGTDKRTGYPIGRIDRSHWTLDHKQYIDCHMFHGIQSDESKFKKTLEMLHTVWPKEDWKWWINYAKEFKKLCQK